MAYKSANLTCLVPRFGGGDNLVGDDGGYTVSLWAYRNGGAGDSLATMQANNYITNGNDVGLRVGDLIIIVQDTVDASWMLVSAISAAGLVSTIVVSNP